MTTEDFKLYERDMPLLHNTYAVARLDIRNAYLLCEDTVDPKLHKLLTGTIYHLMNIGYRTLFGYCIDDEVNLVIHPKDTTCGRMSRRIASHLASEASTYMTLELSKRVICGIELYELPTLELVADYIAYRQASCGGRIRERHCLNTLRGECLDTAQAYSRMSRLSPEEKSKIVSNSKSYAEAPDWHKYGTTIYREKYTKYISDNVPLHKPRSRSHESDAFIGQELYQFVISSIRLQM